MIIAIEGADGSGKHTTATTLHDVLAEKGKSATVLSFPRYGKTAASKTIADYLNEGLGFELDPEVLATYYALDRFESKKVLEDAVRQKDVVILDRYVASNIAYQGARVPDVQRESFINWIRNLEFEVFGLPAPDLTVFLNLPTTIAKAWIQTKLPREYTDLTYDRYEADDTLQARVREIYGLLANEESAGKWTIIDVAGPEGPRKPRQLVDAILSGL